MYLGRDIMNPYILLRHKVEKTMVWIHQKGCLEWLLKHWLLVRFIWKEAWLQKCVLPKRVIKWETEKSPIHHVHSDCLQISRHKNMFHFLLHSQFMTKIQVGHDDRNLSNLGRLRFDQDFMSWLSFDQDFTKDDLYLDQGMTNRLVKSYPKST